MVDVHKESPQPRRTFVVADIHGRKDLLDLVIAKHSENHLIFLGDFVDRGPQSREVLEAVISLHKQGKATILIGNHELMAKAAVNGDHLAGQLWIKNGGDATMKSYPKVDSADNALWNLDLFAEHLNYIFKHGKEWDIVDGVFISHAARPHPEVYNGSAYNEEHFWNRPEDTQHPLIKDTFISVHGHTPVELPTLVAENNAIYFDLAAFKTGKLCVLEPGKTIEDFHFETFQLDADAGS